MITTQLTEAIKSGKFDEMLRDLYGMSNLVQAKKRYVEAVSTFESIYGCRDAEIFSVPGRSEISGNHTDHNRGCTLSASINLDIIAVAAKTDDGLIRIKSKGMDEDICPLDSLNENIEKYTSLSIIKGVADGFLKNGHNIGAFCAYTTSSVFKGSGLSSSAAYENTVGTILSHLYNNGEVPNTEIAKISQYAENKFFGKPCGLLDQATCAVGGFVFIDFKEDEPVIESFPFSLEKFNYSLCIINTGGSHQDLNDDYAAIPAEMKQIAAHFGKKVLRELDSNNFYDSIMELREKYGDRAVLRAHHFFTENNRVLKQKEAIINKDIDEFISLASASGNSSSKCLQNSYCTQNVREQSVSLALALSEHFLSGKPHACRVHGGGFAGTIQCFVKSDDVESFKEYIERYFGLDSCSVLSIRKHGAIKVS